MLSSVLPPVEKIPVGQHPYIIRLLKGVFNSRPPRVKLLPEWNLHKILEMLQKKPFEPMKKAELKFITRLGDGNMSVHSRGVYFIREGLSKQDRPGHFGAKIFVPAFAEKLLDPKRALTYYLKSTDNFRGENRQNSKLFLAISNPHNLISSQTISSWIVSTIQMTYNDKKKSVKAHSTRAIGPSWALYKGASMKNIMEAADWNRESTFTKFYLRHIDPHVLSKTATSLARSRVAVSSQQVIDDYFTLLNTTIEKLGLTDKPAQIWNDDKAGFGKETEQIKQKIIATTGTKNPYRQQMTDYDHITVLACASAAGTFMPNMLIYTKSLPSGRYASEMPSNWIFSTSENGYITRGLFEDWFSRTYLPNIGMRRPNLLVLDNHSSHLSLKVIDMAIENDIEILGIPPHTSHINKFAIVLEQAQDKAWSPHLVKLGFRKTGLHPINSKAIDKSFIRPSHNNTNENNEEDTSMTNPADDVCNKCGRLVTNPLVKAGLVDKNLQDILIPTDITGKQKNKRLTGARIYKGEEMRNELKRKAEEQIEKEEAQKRGKGNKTTPEDKLDPQSHIHSTTFNTENYKTHEKHGLPQDTRCSSHSGTKERTYAYGNCRRSVDILITDALYRSIRGNYETEVRARGTAVHKDLEALFGNLRHTETEDMETTPLTPAPFVKNTITEKTIITNKSAETEKRNVTETNFMLNDAPWSRWQLAITPEFPEGAEYHLWKKRGGDLTGCRKTEICNGQYQKPALYEFAVQTHEHCKRYVVYCKCNKGFTLDKGSWESRLLHKTDVKTEVEDVLKKGCRIFVRHFPLRKTSATTNKMADLGHYDYAWRCQRRERE
ncbi:unnamed protein product [Mytilus coruscus]|uniref:DDE-1 domain-containing protein n=1 Tax=Mytilus coruscus TaxID=42192 RepID=A0A6J8F3K1_MYTCO|nr:unnamed protein product [Mytilus coruscus]